MNIEYMKLAYKQAQIAYKEDEVPVGCVIVKDDVILARAHNKKEKKNLATAHAEIECINKAAKKLNNWNLNGAEMYVTLEPCLMCTGAIINSRISNIYYSTKDPKGGALVSSLKLEDIKTINHHPKIYEGLLQEESSQLLKSFFKRKRKFPRQYMEVLLINLKENQKLKTILTFMNVKYLDVEATQYNDSLFDILNKKSNKTNDKNIEETILIMHEFSKEQMDMLLKLLRSNEIKIDLKCITTPHNLNWNIHSLYQELRQEKLMFLAQNK